MLLALRDLRVARGRFVLVGGVIMLVALLTTLLSGLANGLVSDGISGVRGLPLTHLAFQPGAKHSFSRSTLTPDQLAGWSGKSGVEAAPLGVSFFNAKVPGGSTIDVALFGTSAGSFLATRGDAKRMLAGPPGIVLSHEFSRQGIKVGDELTIVGPDRKLRVLGFTYTGSYGHVDIAFSSLETWQQLMYGDNARGRFSAIAIRAKKSANLDQLAKSTGTEVETKSVSYQGSPGYAAETATMNLIRGFLLAISALIVGAFFTVWSIQRTRQIGLLKALGATNAYIVRDSLGQLAIILTVATSVGALIATGVGQFVGDGIPFSLELRTVLVSSVVLVVLGMTGSLVAIRRISSVDPIIALGADQ